jgi:hypothetical protein
VIDTFSRADFESAISDKAKKLGLINSEFCYLIPLDDRIGIYIRSSIGLDGLCKDSGQDSIRLFLVYYEPFNNRFRIQSEYEYYHTEILGKSINKWITRVNGWQNRLETAINELIRWNQLASYCSECNEPLHFYKVNKDGINKGRIFATCKNNDKHRNVFIWITERR